MLADLVIFSADLFALPPDKFMDAEVTTTIFDGKVIYTRPEPTPIPARSSLPHPQPDRRPSARRGENRAQYGTFIRASDPASSRE